MGFRHRAITTQFQFIERIIVISVWVIAFLSVLCSFEVAKTFAKSLIASAGLVGLLIGFAAQKSLSNLLAGFHIAFTQPIRLDDVVVIEGQWGRVEEITLTYVVVCLWDLRRLVVPIHFFIEKSFENWTKKSTDLLPYVLIHVDYSIPVEEIRKEFERIVKTTPLWDGRVAVLHVFDTSERALILRALMSSSNAPDAAELRFYVREKLIEVIRERYPEYLPKFRFSNEKVEDEFRGSLESLLAK
jgi:small-conductance mechanosensitive channel